MPVWDGVGQPPLNIVTFYPSPDTTSATIGADNSGFVDLVEAVFGGPKKAIKMDRATWCSTGGACPKATAVEHELQERCSHRLLAEWH